MVVMPVAAMRVLDVRMASVVMDLVVPGGVVAMVGTSWRRARARGGDGQRGEHGRGDEHEDSRQLASLQHAVRVFEAVAPADWPADGCGPGSQPVAHGFAGAQDRCRCHLILLASERPA